MIDLLLSSLLQAAVAVPSNCAADHLYLAPQQLGRIRANRMSDLSGLAVSQHNPDVLWVHNGEDIDQVFAIGADGRPAATFTLADALLDAEDIAVGPGPAAGTSYLYLADTGAGAGAGRELVTIVRAPEPLVDPSAEQRTEPLLAPEYLRFRYPHGQHDTEALLLDPVTGDLFLVTKSQSAGQIFRATRAQLEGGGVSDLQPLAEINLPLISGGDISPDGQQIAVRNHETAWVWKRLPPEPIEVAVARPAVRVTLTADEEDGQALAFSPETDGLLTVGAGEDQSLWHYRPNRSEFARGQALGVARAAELREISGITASRQNPGVLWMHNDGTNRTLFAVSTNGTLLTTLDLGVVITDLEDIAAGPGEGPGSAWLYAADIGDNNGDRDEIRVVRVADPDLSETLVQPALVRPTVFRLRYPDGAHDAEALLVDPLSGDLFIATKEEDRFRLYHASKAAMQPEGTIFLDLVHTGNFGLVSGGDISSDGLRIALRREDSARMWGRTAGDSIVTALNRPGEEIPVVGPPTEPNGESLAFEPGGESYFTFSEGEEQPIYLFAPLTLPRIAGGPIRVEGAWQLLLSGCSGRTVVIEASADLARWTPIGESTLTEGGSVFVDSSTHPQLFYRLTLASRRLRPLVQLRVLWTGRCVSEPILPRLAL